MSIQVLRENKINEEISIGEVSLKLKLWYLDLRSKWIWIIGIGLVAALCGYIYASSKVPVYTATTTFVLENSDNSTGLGQYAGIASMVGLDIGGGGGIFQGDNILELYKSRTMIEKTLLSEVENGGKKQLLVERYIDFNHLRKTWSKNPQLFALHFQPFYKREITPFTRLQDSVLASIAGAINRSDLTVAKPDKTLSIIRVDLRSPDELFSKSFNDQIVKNVNDFFVQTKTKKSLQNVTILKQKVDSVSRVMNGAIYNIAAVADATPNLNPTRQLQRAAPMQRSQFSAETNKAILAELVKNLELSKIALLKETPLIQIVDAPQYPLERYKLGNLKAAVICAIGAMGFAAISRLIKLLLGS
jgi:hypothetical protein